MKRNYLVAWILSLIAAAGVGFYIGSRTGSKGSKQGTFDLQVYFDGGYVFDFSPPTSVDVYALRKANFPMKVQVMTTAGSVPIDLTGFELSLLPDGIAPTPARPGAPPNDPTQVDCKDSDQLNPNNLFFLPSLTEVAARTGTKIKSASELEKATVLHLTGGGAVSVKQLGGCVEFRYDQGARSKRSMVSGIGGVMYKWRGVPGSYLSLEWHPLSDPNGNGTSMLAKPDASGIVQLRVSTFPAVDPPPDPAPFEITHFKDHFGDAFASSADLKKVSLWWLGTYLTSPGIDCPSGGI